MKYRIAPGLPLSHDMDTSTLPPNRGHIHVAIHLASSPDFHLFVSPLFKEHVVHSAPRRSMRRRDRQCNTCAAQKKTPPFAKRDKTRPPSGDIHSIITSSHRLHYCPIILFTHHWTQLSRASAPRLYNSLSHLASVTRLASKGLGVDFFFLYTSREPCVCFFVSWLQLLSKVRVHEDRQGFLYRTLVSVVLFFFFVSYQIWEGRDSGREGERGDMHDMYTYIYLPHRSHAESAAMQQQQLLLPLLLAKFFHHHVECWCCSCGSHRRSHCRHGKSFCYCCTSTSYILSRILDQQCPIGEYWTDCGFVFGGTRL